MPKFIDQHSITSKIIRIKILDSSQTDGRGLTGLTYESSGLIISTIADNESVAMVYSQSSGTIETITTLGTYSMPTTDKCRFKEVDSINHPGIYEIQLANARFSVSNAKSLIISILGATNCAECDAEIQLSSVNLNDSVRGGMTALPNAAAAANGGLPTVDTNNYLAGIQGTKNTLDDLNDVSEANVNTQVDTALSDINLDHLLKVPVASVDDLTAEVVDGTILSAVISKDADTSDYDLDSDSLEAIRDQLVSEGAGSAEGTLTINDGDGNAIDNVRVWLTSDSAGTTVVGGVKTTNASGQVTFMIDTGATYYVWREHSSYTFTNPQTWQPTS
ncbi:MAG: hypothetical protein A3K77_00535 [Euryarchaeota archaeon RBG_13_31_8]|nr:MAG: hypothetical protein A3K77_00535 [Euryarchaeota archaeon RBG_13_31_8]